MPAVQANLIGRRGEKVINIFGKHLGSRSRFRKRSVLRANAYKVMSGFSDIVSVDLYSNAESVKRSPYSDYDTKLSYQALWVCPHNSKAALLPSPQVIKGYLTYDVNKTGDVDELRGTVPVQLMSVVYVRDTFHKQIVHCAEWIPPPP